MAELWDLFDEDRRPTGKTVERGAQDGCSLWHVVVFVAVRNSRGEYCITKRDEKKYLGGLWEFTGGSAVAGETSEHAALRETFEETGIDYSGSRRTLIATRKKYWDDGELGWHGDFDDIWLFEADFPIENVKLLEGETTDAMWATPEELKEMARKGDFCDPEALDIVLNFKE